MLHFHGTPITPREKLYELAGRHFCVSYAAPAQVKTCHEIGQSVMLDNGAFSIWRDPKRPPVDWEAWADWVQPWLDYPTTWAVLPDVIDGTEAENDYLASIYHWVTDASAPVWHLHESFGRLERLCATYSRVCFGSSGQYAVPGTSQWHRRVSEAFDRIASPAGRVPWIHMLRGMAYCDVYPFGSADSTDIAQNHHRPQNTPCQMADRWDAKQPHPRWWHEGTQQLLKEIA